MRCVFCQNYIISTNGKGEIIDNNKFRDIILQLQEQGALNINLVSPTPYTHLLIPILTELKKSDLKIPIVWNSNAYENVEIIKQLEGLVEIYLPDFKYWNNDNALKYSNIKNYRESAQESIKEMFRQTGNLVLTEDYIAIFGTMIRLLVLPNNLNGIEYIIEWIFNTFGNEIYLSLMSQYYPTENVKFELLKRGILTHEYEYALDILHKYGFENGFIQPEPSCTPEWTPSF
jgi:putative pyruvate formate lyase activating enzyme